MVAAWSVDRLGPRRHVWGAGYQQAVTGRKIFTGTPEFLGLRSRDRQGWIKRPDVFHLPPFIWSRTRGLFGSTIFAKGNLAISRAGFARCCWYDHQAPDLGLYGHSAKPAEGRRRVPADQSNTSPCQIIDRLKTTDDQVERVPASGR